MKLVPPNKSPEPTVVGAVSAFVKPQIIVRFESTVAQLSTLGIKIGLMVELVGWSGEDLSS
jgi:hypothetical protein